jgi:hypothetical protein
VSYHYDGACQCIKACEGGDETCPCNPAHKTYSKRLKEHDKKMSEDTGNGSRSLLNKIKKNKKIDDDMEYDKFMGPPCICDNQCTCQMAYYDKLRCRCGVCYAASMAGPKYRTHKNCMCPMCASHPTQCVCTPETCDYLPRDTTDSK